MYIVGTSGHIDHGKTSLIKALTGIDCDRLPEEKAREMTIDIGFAKIEFPKFGIVSVIDVPGHERFIRNMVVGAWGIDLALLVIDVNDSWMPQTEDHFRVIDLLGIERMIAVLTKIDAADQDIIQFAEEETREKLNNSRFKDSGIIKVSSKTGQGLEDLKKGIQKNLEKLSIAANAEKPYLFIDRVFESRGHGTIVTGTLKNGILDENEDVQILPGFLDSRIKKIESHFDNFTGSPSQRTALNLSGVSTNELKRGHIIIKKNFFSESHEILSILNLSENKSLKNNTEIEILIGASCIKGKIIYLNSDISGNTIPAKIKFSGQWFFYPGEPFIITNPGGYRVIGGGRVLLPDTNILKEKNSIKEKINLFKGFSQNEIIFFLIQTYSAVKTDYLKSILPYANSVIDKLIGDMLVKNLVIQTENFIADRDYVTVSKNEIMKIVKNNIGLNIKEISDISGIDLDFCRILTGYVQKENNIIEKEGKYFTNDSITSVNLSSEKKKLLDLLKSSAGNGMELSKIREESVKKNIKELIRLGFAVSLDGNIVYHSEIYESLKNEIMKLFSAKEQISVTDAKEVTDLSRKYLLPLLNRIENEGLIKRYGDFRVKV